MLNIKKTNLSVNPLGCFLVILTQAGITLYLPSLPTIQQQLHTTHYYMALSLTSYMLGYAIPMLLWGGLADKLGRRNSLLIAILTFSISSFFLANSYSILVFILLRFLQGAGGGGMCNNRPDMHTR